MEGNWQVQVFIWMLGSFIAGSIPWGYVIVKLFYRDDIRLHGSGNIGFTNVYRLYGWAPGLICFALDILKGLVPVLIVTSMLGAPIGNPGEWLQAGVLMLVSVAAILGHVFTPWLKFKGGKGVATGLGVLIGLLGWLILVPLAVFLIVMLPTRYVSLGSITATIAFLVMPFVIRPVFHYWPMGILVAVLVLYTHRENIKRLIAGSENRFDWKSKKEA